MVTRYRAQSIRREPVELILSPEDASFRTEVRRFIAENYPLEMRVPNRRPISARNSRFGDPEYHPLRCAQDVFASAAATLRGTATIADLLPLPG
jgi:hypothetical protein